MKRKFPFLIRLFLGLPAIILTSVLWAIIFLCSQQAFGRVLIKTGRNFVDEPEDEELAENYQRIIGNWQKIIG